MRSGDDSNNKDTPVTAHFRDSLLTREQQKEQFSIVYVRAVVARLRYDIQRPEIDQDGIDLTIQSGGKIRPRLDLQLKATTRLKNSKDGYLGYKLKVRNYDLLRLETQTPRLLVILDMPSDDERWMKIKKNKLILRHRAYWLSLRGCNPTRNRYSITVKIPVGNLFDVSSVRKLMEQSMKGHIRSDCP